LIRSEEFSDGRYYVILHLAREFRINGYAQHFRSQVVGHFIALPTALRKTGEAFLLVHREGVVDFTSYPAVHQMIPERIAAALPPNSQGELVPDMLVMLVADRQDNPCLSQCFFLGSGTAAVLRRGRSNPFKHGQLLNIISGVLLAGPRIRIIITQFHPEQSGLKRIEPKIPSDLTMKVFRL
tara:strand:+ start:73 stop:618 length:546 start_codon:yes stop_codon:yes gene_type:complete